MENSISVSMHIGSGKNAINNMEKIKRADLHNNRKYKNNKNQEIDLSLSKYNITIIGTKNITEDIKKFYQDEFAEAVYNYNKNQKDERRKIVNYLEKMSKDSKSNIATEFIFQMGDKEDWENKSPEDKQKTVEIFKKAIPILEKRGIKIVNASLHLDETSPHLHLIAVPIIENQKRGLSKQVSQNKVITKSTITEIRKEVEKAFILEYNKIYNTNMELKKGSEIEEHLQVQDYKDTKKVIDIAKKVADKEKLKKKVSEDLQKVNKEFEESKKELETEEKKTNEILNKCVEEKRKNDRYEQEFNKIKENIEFLKEEIDKREKEKNEEQEKLEKAQQELEHIRVSRINQENLLMQLQEKEKEKIEKKEKLEKLLEDLKELNKQIEATESNIKNKNSALEELKTEATEREVEVEKANGLEKERVLKELVKKIHKIDKEDIYYILSEVEEIKEIHSYNKVEFKNNIIQFITMLDQNLKQAKYNSDEEEREQEMNKSIPDEIFEKLKELNKYEYEIEKEEKTYYSKNDNEYNFDDF